MSRSSPFEAVIVGAGVSSAAFYHTAHPNLGRSVFVEKARGPGGRASCRRVACGELEFRFDHGAQFFTVRDERFKAIVEKLENSGHVKPWLSHIPHADYSEAKASKRYCGVRGMSSLVKALLADANCLYSWKVKSLRFEDGLWMIENSESEEIFGKRLILSTPMPQAMELLQTLKLPEQGMLKNIHYEPCWAVLFGSREAFALPGAHAAWLESAEGIEWVCDNHKKGISAFPALSVHLTAQKSRELLNATPDSVIDWTESQLRSILPKNLDYRAAHRWLYSRSAQAGREPPFLYFEEPGPLWLIGDALAGGRIEGAALSGIAAATHLLRS